MWKVLEGDGFGQGEASFKKFPLPKVFPLSKSLQIIFQLALDDRDLRAVDDLNTAAASNDTARTALTELGIGDEIGVLDRDAQTCGAAVEGNDVFLAAKPLQDERRNVAWRAGDVGALLFAVVVGTGVELYLVISHLASGREIVVAENEETEEEEIHNEIEDSHKRHHDPVGLGVALNDAKQGQVDDTAREGHAHTHAENVHE